MEKKEILKKMTDVIDGISELERKDPCPVLGMYCNELRALVEMLPQKRIAYNPHIIMQICKDVRVMKRQNSECHSSKCTVTLQNIESLLEKKEII